MKFFLKTVLFVFIAAISIELISFSVFRAGVVNTNWQPYYSRDDTTIFWRTESEVWGAWHLADTKARHTESCFDIPVRSNSYGARDRERTLNGKNRVLVLGDSYVEGWGVEENSRFTNLMEQMLKIEILNFGTNHWFGPLQYEILYQDLASKFDHDVLIVGFAPHNDFTDNDLNTWKAHTSRNLSRYRPYYGDDGITPIYTVPQPSKGISIANLPFFQPSLSGKLIAFGRNYLWSFGWLKIGKQTYNSWFGEENSAKINPSRGYSGYRDFEIKQLNNIFGSFERIGKLASEKQRTVYLVVFPSSFDLQISKNDNRLTPLLRKFGAKNNIHVIDLLEHIEFRDEDFQACNWFWSEEGHKKVSEVLSRELTKKLKDRLYH